MADRPETLDTIDQQFHAQLMSEFADMQASLKTWQRFLVHKYGLQTGDTLTADGAIVRIEAEPDSQVDV